MRHAGNKAGRDGEPWSDRDAAGPKASRIA
jgi:hypothetical protein